MEGGGYADTKETIYLFPMDRRWIVMKKIEFNFKYTDDKKDNKKSSKMSEILKAFFISLITSVLASLIIKIFFGL